MRQESATPGGNGPLHPESIPAELKAIPRWLLWKLEQRAGKPTKTPYQACGTLAKVNDPSTWTDFDSALAAYLKGGFSGIGIVLIDDDDLVGIDLDKCLNPVTGELDPDAARIINDLPSYCEVSPSGRGLRLFGFGTLPQGGRRKGHVEMYESGRYLTVTGNRFNGHAALAHITPELAQVHARIFAKPDPVDAKPGKADPPNLDDAELLDKARRARNGAEFDRLWSGDKSGQGEDHSAADLALCNLLAFWTGNDPARMDRLFRQSVLFRPDKWDKAHSADGRTYGQMTLDKAIAGNRETYSGRAQSRPIDEETAWRCGVGEREPGCDDDVGEAPEPAPLDLDAYRGTDDANAVLFLQSHGDDVRFCPPWDKWLLWTGSHWRIDDCLDIHRLSADVPRLLYRRAGEAADSSERRKIATLAGKLEGTTKQAAMLTAVRHRVVVHHSDLDKGRFLLNARNATVDLTTGRTRNHDRADLLTHDTDISYQPNATAPTWIRFLQDVFAGDADLIRFVQRAVGYSLTGDVREQVLLICHGIGSNGKSKFLNIVRAMLGKLALQAAADLLMADRNRRHPTEQADLFGKRLVVCQETGEGRRFNETLVKQLTGGDAIRARRMHEDFWEFEPTHKLWLSTNHKPEIRGTDYAIWRRIRLIPFNVQFTDDSDPRKDPTMEDRLMAELPGILAWAVQGCLDWQKHGLGMAEAVKSATAGYQADMDVLAAWLADCCVIHRNAKARASALYRAYADWCEQSGEHAENQRKFGQRLSERGLQRYSNDGVWYRGIGLRADGTEGAEPVSTIFTPPTSSDQNFCQKASDSSVSSANPADEGLPSQPPPVEPQPDPYAARVAELVALGWSLPNAKARALDEARDPRMVGEARS